jgi:hypothetical protein
MFLMRHIQLSLIAAVKLVNVDICGPYRRIRVRMFVIQRVMLLHNDLFLLILTKL